MSSSSPEVRALAAKIARFYALPNCAAGGPLHIVLDDLNVENHHILWCLRDMSDRASARHRYTPQVRAVAWEIAEDLLGLSEKQRFKACREAHEVPLKG